MPWYCLFWIKFCGIWITFITEKAILSSIEISFSTCHIFFLWAPVICLLVSFVYLPEILPLQILSILFLCFLFCVVFLRCLISVYHCTFTQVILIFTTLNFLVILQWFHFSLSFLPGLCQFTLVLLRCPILFFKLFYFFFFWVLIKQTQAYTCSKYYNNVENWILYVFFRFQSQKLSDGTFIFLSFHFLSVLITICLCTYCIYFTVGPISAQVLPMLVSESWLVVLSTV